MIEYTLIAVLSFYILRNICLINGKLLKLVLACSGNSSDIQITTKIYLRISKLSGKCH